MAKENEVVKLVVGDPFEVGPNATLCIDFIETGKWHHRLHMEHNYNGVVSYFELFILKEQLGVLADRVWLKDSDIMSMYKKVIKKRDE